MQGEESRQSRTRDDWTSQNQLDEGGTENGNAARDGCPNTEPPICILIEAQYLPAECHAQCHQQQKDANDPGKFAGKLVRSKEKYLNHVNQNNRDHEIRAPAMHGADEPAESDIVVECLQAAPRFRARRHINQREQNSRHNLQHEDRQRGAAKHVPPARRVPRHGMFGHCANWRRKLQSTVEPVANSSDHDAHGGFSPVSSAIAAPGVGSSPAWMVTSSFSTLYGYSKRPRFGGPEAREPSR